MKTPRLILVAVLAASSAVCAATATTEFVGFNTLTCLGNSDTRFSLPLHRPHSYQGLVSSVSGNVVTVQGAPAWSTNPQLWVYASPAQTNTYYVEFTTGAKMGMFYTVTANGVGTLTLDLAGDNIASVVNGDALKIIPYWTLATVFSGQAGITTTGSITGAGSATKVLLPSPAAGTNLPSVSQYYYYRGTGFTGPGWRNNNSAFTSIRNDDVLAPDSYVIIRQTSAPTTTLTLMGVVPMNERKYFVGTLAGGGVQDNAVAVDIPVPLTLTQSNLFQCGAFTGTTSISGTSGDRILIFDDAIAGQNKPATKFYYYYTGTGFGGAGWRSNLNGFFSIRNTDAVFQPGSGLVIRKQATTPNSVTTVWSVPLPY